MKVNKQTLIDTHCHFDFPVFDKQQDLILSACQKQSVMQIVVPGVCAQHWQRVLLLAQQYQAIYPALGLHPCFLHEHQESELKRLDQLCETESLVAIGEIGLDYYKGADNKHAPLNQSYADKEKQNWYFSQQLQIAAKHNLAVLIHARRSHSDVLENLKKYQPLKGIIHAYSGSYEQAREYLKLGFKLGFGGAYTYPKATKLRALIARIPLQAWVLETDAPDMSPIAHKGQTNSPQYLAEIAQEFINLYNESAHPNLTHIQILAQLNANSHEVMSLN